MNYQDCARSSGFRFSMSESAPPIPFPFGVRLGMVFMVVSASLSACACLGCLLFIAYNSCKIGLDGSRKWSLETHVHYYFLNLLVFDLIASIGGLINIKWVMDAGVTEGGLCTTQAVFKQMGDLGVAFTSLIIAIHTLCVVAFRWRFHPKTAVLVISSMWIFIALLVGVSAGIHSGRHYYGNTQYWCWITGDYKRERIALDSCWLWIAAFLNIVIYMFLAFIIKGVIVIDNSKIRLQRHQERATSHFTSGIGTQMLYYPAVYIITVFPIAVTRFMAFDGHHVPFPATAFASMLLSSSGLINVILFKLTRPRLLPIGEVRSSTLISTLDIPTCPSKTRSFGRCREHDLCLDDLEISLTPCASSTVRKPDPPALDLDSDRYALHGKSEWSNIQQPVPTYYS